MLLMVDKLNNCLHQRFLCSLVLVFLLSLSLVSAAAAASSPSATPSSSYGVTARLTIADVAAFRDGRDEEISYNFGYIRGYNDAKSGGAMGSYYIFNIKRIIGLNPTSQQAYEYNEMLFAKEQRGDYLTGYREGYKDSATGNPRKIATDFLNEYGLGDITALRKVEPSATRRVPSTSISFFKRYAITPDMTVSDIAYTLGKRDAEEKNGKDPFRVLAQLKTLASIEADQLHRRLSLDRGTFLNFYNAGYLSVTSPAKKKVDYSNVEQSQKPTSVRLTDAEQLGTKYGRLHALMGLGKQPYNFVHSPRLLEGKISSDVAIAQSETQSYVQAYRRAYDDITVGQQQERYTWDQRLYQLGYEHGAADRLAGAASRPYSYIHFYKVSDDTKNLEIGEYLKVYINDFIKGYRDGYKGTAA